MFIPYLCHCRRNAWTAKHDAPVSRRCWTTWRGKITKSRVASNTSIRPCPNKEEWLHIRKLWQPLSTQQNTTDQNIMARSADLSRMWKNICREKFMLFDQQTRWCINWKWRNKLFPFNLMCSQVILAYHQECVDSSKVHSDWGNLKQKPSKTHDNLWTTFRTKLLDRRNRLPDWHQHNMVTLFGHCNLFTVYTMIHFEAMNLTGQVLVTFETWHQFDNRYHFMNNMHIGYFGAIQLHVPKLSNCQTCTKVVPLHVNSAVNCWSRVMVGICLVEMSLDHNQADEWGPPKKFLLFVPVPAFYQLH